MSQPSSPLTLSSLPLFPLDTVLFPGGILPLRIFEIRYLDMIKRCEEANAPFGVVSLLKGSEVRQAGVDEMFNAIGTLATIESMETIQAGLLEVRCRGTQRFRITSSAKVKYGLWTADIAQIDDDQKVTVPDELQDCADALEKLLETLKVRNPEGLAVAEPWQIDDCAWVSNRWCEFLPLSPELRQRLMELDNPVIRLELVSDLLAKARIGKT